MDFLTSSKKLLNTLLFTSAFVMSATAQAGLIFDEANLGDFDPYNLTKITLAGGTNQVLGQSAYREINPNDNEADFDSFIFTVAEGYSLAAIRYSAFAEAPSGEAMGAGYVLRSYHPTSIWGDILDQAEIDILAMSAQGMFSKVLPLSAGSYIFENNMLSRSFFEGRKWQYRIEFDVVNHNPAPVNAPGTLLLLSGLLGFITWRRR